MGRERSVENDKIRDTIRAYREWTGNLSGIPSLRVFSIWLFQETGESLSHQVVLSRLEEMIGKGSIVGLRQWTCSCKHHNIHDACLQALTCEGCGGVFDRDDVSARLIVSSIDVVEEDNGVLEGA
jgi:hypothetical protein